MARWRTPSGSLSSDTTWLWPSVAIFDRRCPMFAGARDNAGAAVALAAVTYGIGGLAMAVQSKVDTVIFDYANENGGLMGLALQVPKDQGKRCQEWLARFGVKVEEPSASATPTKK